MSEEEKRDPPVFKQKVGTVEASVWENKVEAKGDKPEGSFLTVSSHRDYLDKTEKWQSTNSLRINDIPTMILALQKCYEYAKIKETEGKKE